MKLSFSNYVQMREANITQTNTVGQVAKVVAGQAAGRSLPPRRVRIAPPQSTLLWPTAAPVCPR